jgi:hypothetical protein
MGKDAGENSESKLQLQVASCRVCLGFKEPYPKKTLKANYNKRLQMA